MAQSALIKITIDPGRGTAIINGLKVSLDQLAAAQKKVTEETEKGVKAIQGSVKYYEILNAKLKAEQKALSTNAEEWDKYSAQIKINNDHIARITQNKEKEIASIKGSFQYYETQIKMLRRQQKEFANTNEAVLIYEKQIQKLRAEQRALAEGTKLTGKGMQTMSTASGLAGAAATEFGRTIGDLPYGIQGVSNNVQQLTALFTDLVQAQGGLNKALKVFTSTLMGPAGILVAVSLVTTAYELFAKKSKEAKDATASFNLDLESQIVNLQLVIDAFESQDPAVQSKRLELLAAFSGLNENISEAYQKQLISQNEVLDLLRQQNTIANAKLKLDDKDAKILDEVKKIREDSSELESELLKKRDLLGKITETSVNRDIRRSEINNDILRIEGEIADKAKQVKDLVAGRTDDLLLIADAEIFIKSREEEIGELLKENKAIVANSIKDYEKKIEAIKEEMSNVDLQSKKYQELDKQLAQLNYTYEQLLITQRMLDIEALDRAMEAADKRIEIAMNAITSEQDLFAKRKELAMREQGQQEEYETWAKGYYKRLSEDQAFSEEERLKFKEIYLNFVDKINKREEERADENAKKIKKADEEKNKQLIATLQNIKKLTSTINDFLDSEAQREIDRETNKTNAINEQLRERLRNEELSKDERDLINQEIARNEAALVNKENEIAKKRFNQQKAFNIAIATIDTYVAANQALKDQTLVSTFAKVAAMVSIIATGLANVATISRQQFVGRVAKSPTLRGEGGGGASAPAFNVVGASSQNQLAETIAGQQSSPLKAYVVADDVTTAQELSRKTITAASI